MNIKQSNTAQDGHLKNPLAVGFARFIRRLSIKLSAPEEAADTAAQAAGVCMEALSEGDVCVNLYALSLSLGRSEEETRGWLMRSGVAALYDEEKKLPLVIDAQGRIYLRRYYDYEKQLADAVAARIHESRGRLCSPETLAFIDERFAQNAAKSAVRPDRQKLAVLAALASSLTIISGGPGTGKTTIVAAFIAALALTDPPPRIALAAPTGKAAARMEQAVRKQIGELGPGFIQRLPDRASTLHMLLGARPESGEFRHHRNNPLPYDLVIVDEASMMDLSLAARLFDALSPETGVVFLGDKDQLAAVEAGAVFADLARQSSMEPGDEGVDDSTGGRDAAIQNRPGNEKRNLSDCVVWLTENYRFDAHSPIGKLARWVAGGKDRELADWLPAQQSAEMRWRAVEDGLPARMADELACGFEPYVRSVREGDPAAALRAYEKFCVLCAVRRGSRGVDAINAAMTRKLRLSLSGEAFGDQPWYHGRPVMITENDYGREIFNGDIGIALAGKDGRLGVWFAGRDGSVRTLAPSLLPAHQTAFAMTVHKAQGSEFESVALVLPGQDSPVLTRELIYTAVTRARRSLSLYGSLDILRQAVKRPTDRRGGLADRMEDHPR